MKYTVIRQHFGDRMYMPGEERDATASDVQHLVKAGVLEEAKAKAEKPVANKAEKSAPKNKSE